MSTILRDDTPTHKWKREATFTTEVQAEAYIKDRLNITAAAASASQAPSDRSAAEKATV